MDKCVIQGAGQARYPPGVHEVVPVEPARPAVGHAATAAVAAAGDDSRCFSAGDVRRKMPYKLLIAAVYGGGSHRKRLDKLRQLDTGATFLRTSLRSWGPQHWSFLQSHNCGPRSCVSLVQLCVQSLEAALCPLWRRLREQEGSCLSSLTVINRCCPNNNVY